MKKIVVILGPTASGKSDIAVAIARKFGSEIVSADSRQVYKDLDIGTGKITKKEMKGVPHYLLDVADPRLRSRFAKATPDEQGSGGQAKKLFSASEFVKLANRAITQIVDKGKLPIICGGTGFYISALLEEVNIPEVKPNIKLRKRLDKKSIIELFEILKRLDPERAKNIDNQNPRRLIRAIEITKALGKVPKIESRESKYEVLKIGIRLRDKELRKKINKRIDKRLKQGLIKEVENLYHNGLSWKRMSEIGLEYKIVSQFLMSRTRLDSQNTFIYQQKKMSRAGLDILALKKTLGEKIWQYAKRQKTWFKRDRKIIWLPPNIKRIQDQVSTFLNK